LDKIRQEKLKRFRESLTNKFSNDDFKTEDNRTTLSIPWKDNGEYQTDDSDCQRYLRTLNASIFLRIKSLNERLIDLSISNHLKPSEQILYNESLVHLTYYSKLSSNTCLGFSHFTENNSSFKQWLSLANTSEHYPYMIFGGRATGKTLLCTKIVQYLLNTLGKNVQCIIRYFNVTSLSRNIVEIFSSICTQMSALQHAPSFNNEQQTDRIEYYQTVLAALSKNQKPLILMIDGIEEITPQSQHVSTIACYQTLLKLLPPKVRSSPSISVLLRPNKSRLIFFYEFTRLIFSIASLKFIFRFM
jgi:hypothetical protein